MSITNLKRLAQMPTCFGNIPVAADVGACSPIGVVGQRGVVFGNPKTHDRLGRLRLDDSTLVYLCSQCNF